MSLYKKAILVIFILFLTNYSLSEEVSREEFGKATALSRRLVLLEPFAPELSFHYGLVGSLPTRFVNEIKMSLLPYLELRTSLSTFFIPDSLMARLGFGDLKSLGFFCLDFGMSKLDFGLRLNPDEMEQVSGIIVTSFALGFSYDKRLGSRNKLHLGLRVQQRFSNEKDSDQTAFLGTIVDDFDLSRFLGMSFGISYSKVMHEVKDFTLNFVGYGLNGFESLIDRDHKQSFNLLWGMTYARTEKFDVDLFSSFMLYPSLEILFGAGLRWKFDFS